MFNDFSLNRFLKVAYPTIVFLFTVLAWNTSGQVTSRDFHEFPEALGPSWRTISTILQPSCETDRPRLQVGGSCSFDVGQPKLWDKKKLSKHEARPSKSPVQIQIEASRSSSLSNYQ